MRAKRLEPDTRTKGASVPVVGWWRPEGARLLRKRTGQRTREWVVVRFPLGHRRELYDTDRLLPRFLALADARRRQILAFARRYGIPQDPFRAWRQFPDEPGNSWGMELSDLRRYASRLRATLRLQRRVEDRRAYSRDADDTIKTVREFLRDEGLVPDRMRELRHPYAAHDVPRVGPADLPKWWDLQRDRVIGVVNYWLERGIHPQAVALPNGRLAVRWTGGLWGALGGQLLYALRREANVAICDYCDREFRLSRRPRKGAAIRCCPRKPCERRYRAGRMQQTRARRAEVGGARSGRPRS